MFVSVLNLNTCLLELLQFELIRHADIGSAIGGSEGGGGVQIFAESDYAYIAIRYDHYFQI